MEQVTLVPCHCAAAGRQRAGLHNLELPFATTLHTDPATFASSMVAAVAQLARPAQWALLQAPGCSSQAAPAPCSARRRNPARRSALRNSRACAAGKSQPDLPPPDAPPSAVADWASAQFLEAARSNLTKACLLLALEEEAAAQSSYLDAEGLGPESVAALRGCGAAGGAAVGERLAVFHRQLFTA